MKKLFTTILAIAAGIAAMPVFAQDEIETSEKKLEVSASADLVSTYIWRGQKVTSASFQPSLGLSYAGFSLGAWGSTDFDHAINEFDLAASYSISGFTIGLTDYFGPYSVAEDGRFSKFGTYDNHILELNAGFDFGEVCDKFALTVSANVNLLNDKDEKDDERYSTYIELGYPVKVGDVAVDFALGMTPSEGMYSEGLNIVNISIKGSKELELSPKWKLPVFTQAILNPNTEQAYLVFGMTF